MKVLSKLYDERVESTNVLVELTTKEYLSFAPALLKRNNEFQRRRVRQSGKIYSLLKEDLKRKCVIPPIVLAYTDDLADDEKEMSDGDLTGMPDDALTELIETNKDKLLIIDGLQRTCTLTDAEPKLSDCLNNKLRLEIYMGIRKQAILYRMLTLNSGQTPMSLRHQIEILYSCYLDNDSPEGIRLIRETDDRTPTKSGEYNFSDIIDGFQSYIRRDELPTDRKRLLENIKSLSGLSAEKQNGDLFHEYVTAFHSFVTKMESLYGDWKCDWKIGGSHISGEPLGRDAKSVFSKSVVMTGFGSAMGKLMDDGIISQIKDMKNITEDPEFCQKCPGMSLDELLYTLDSIRTFAKSIGNAQRIFFHYFFRELFDKSSDSYGDIEAAIEKGHERYVYT